MEQRKRIIFAVVACLLVFSGSAICGRMIIDMSIRWQNNVVRKNRVAGDASRKAWAERRGQRGTHQVILREAPVYSGSDIHETHEIMGDIFKALREHKNGINVPALLQVVNNLHPLDGEKWLDEDEVIQGKKFYQNSILSFYPSGKIKTVILTKNTEINGVELMPGSAVDVELYESGKTKRGKLAKNMTAQGIEFKGGSVIEFYESGAVEKGFMTGNAVINDVEFSVYRGVEFYESGKIEKGSLAKDAIIQDVEFVKDKEMEFYESGSVRHGCFWEIKKFNILPQHNYISVDIGVGDEPECFYCGNFTESGEIENYAVAGGQSFETLLP
jgi:hypothetical protein